MEPVDPDQESKFWEGLKLQVPDSEHEHHGPHLGHDDDSSTDGYSSSEDEDAAVSPQVGLPPDIKNVHEDEEDDENATEQPSPQSVSCSDYSDSDESQVAATFRGAQDGITGHVSSGDSDSDDDATSRGAQYGITGHVSCSDDEDESQVAGDSSAPEQGAESDANSVIPHVEDDPEPLARGKRPANQLSGDEASPPAIEDGHQPGDSLAKRLAGEPSVDNGAVTPPYDGYAASGDDQEPSLPDCWQSLGNFVAHAQEHGLQKGCRITPESMMWTVLEMNKDRKGAKYYQDELFHKVAGGGKLNLDELRKILTSFDIEQLEARMKKLNKPQLIDLCDKIGTSSEGLTKPQLKDAIIHAIKHEDDHDKFIAVCNLMPKE